MAVLNMKYGFPGCMVAVVSRTVEAVVSLPALPTIARDKKMYKWYILQQQVNNHMHPVDTTILL